MGGMDGGWDGEGSPGCGAGSGAGGSGAGSGSAGVGSEGIGWGVCGSGFELYMVMWGQGFSEDRAVTTVWLHCTGGKDFCGQPPGCAATISR